MTHVYSVDPGRPFLTVLAEALLAGDLPAPGGKRPDALGLADITVYLPTRRPARALQQAFLEAAGGRALLLPKIKMLGADSEELELIAAAAEEFGAGGGDIPRAIGELERQLLLTTLVQAWARREQQGGDPESEEPDEAYTPTGARSPAQAARLARELARLIDELEADGIAFERLKGLPGEDYAEQWKRRRCAG
jgi:ATP-dependent helicase/nuclease subunit B